MKLVNSLKKTILSLLACITLMAFVEPAPTPTGLSNTSAADIYELNLDKSAHVVFWRKIMNLHKDSCIVNVHGERKILAVMHAPTWTGLQDQTKYRLLDSFRKMHGIIDTPRIVSTMGKSFFYTFEKVSVKVPVGMQAFEKNGVDGWYAKAILLIESPNQLQKSTAGAYGPFQLMKGVAKSFGLRVNKKVDERANFNRSAYAASQLIKTVCIPYAQNMLLAKGITPKEDELWFKLFGMHIYNAGAGNVQMALNSIPQPGDGIELIKQLWNTSAGRFQTASQNYSQLILAAFLEYEERVENKQVSRK
jgi:hypothetical protein